MSDKVGPAERPSKFTVTLDELEDAVRVPLDEQVTEQAPARPVDDMLASLDSRRQARLAGGA